MSRVRDKLARGELVLCMGLRQARTADIPMIAAQAGFDSIYVDMEHSPVSLESVSTLCAGALGAGITPIVRPPGHGADWISRVLESSLFEVTATDPLTYGAVSLLLLTIALIACVVPASRAAVMNPIVALRHD